MKIYLFILTVVMLMIAAAAHAQCTWTQQHAAEGLHYYWAMDFSDTLHGWVGRSPYTSDAMLRTVDGGRKWDIATTLTPRSTNIGPIKGMSFVDSLNGWIAVPDDITLYRTRDGGKTWKDLYVAHYPGLPLDNIKFLDTLHGWSIDRDTGWGLTRIQITKDGGKSWRSVQAANPYPYSYQMIDTLRGWIVGPAINKTTDGGLSWQTQSYDSLFGSITVYQLRASSFVDSLHGWAGSTPSDYIIYTNNGGNTWTTLGHVDVAITPIIQNIQFTDTLNGWVCGTSFYFGSLRGIVYKTTDGGKTWTLMLRGVSEGFEKIKMFDRCHGWLLSHDGTIMALDPTTGIPCESFIVPESISLSQNYPNPFNPVTTVRFSLPKWQHVTITVSDELGRNVMTLYDAETDAGEHSVPVNASALSSGVYFYTMKTGGQLTTKKMTVIK